ncbi:helix-turn-helix domain-containing protein [Isoptericola halotolerans]|uniref:PucR family transcriptional regulator n=1 Tax=Isoptericola halotolerans TaxID=300560 RepID=UPI00388DC5E8
MPDVAPAAPAPPRTRVSSTPARSRHQLVASVLDGSCPLAELRRAAVTLGMPVGGRYRVVALEALGRARRATARATVATGGVRVHWHVSHPVEHGIVQLDGDHVADLGGATLPAGVRLGVSLPAEGLAGLADARRQAVTALDLCPPDGGHVDLSSHLPVAVLDADPTLADQLRRQVLGPLADADEPDGAVVLDTFAHWIAADGSTREAARRLGCHRNTVTNRLRRL